MFARPLTGADYVLAKLGAMVSILFAFSFLPQVVLFVGNMLVSDSAYKYFTGHLDVLWKVPLSVAMLAIYYAIIGVAVASLTDRRIVAGAGIIGLLLVTSIASHPVVRTHPVTGKKALYVNRGFTRYLIGIPRDESDAMLSYLYQHAENPLFQCRFRWTENAIAFWDNRCTQHRAMWDYWPHTRAGTRVTVKGERPV